ncbi:hypothetical protein HanXRQr2_Chr15g0688091 [Helianthus annuus]|uniref:Nodulin-related protein 1 n=1 Tax=Helianthus annuus TaxID=4232 RepID=A0A251S7R9_HELAN|nr:nodulin-related protein 1 [Helianthus annuus]KAF5764098.1 hypothetical protein HanXRQr2_Chr15g0688091 [Helianthus annuus]KAJ0472682.1 hypothetical protein HanHA89_Chr15g0609801 [Helianthus annuus]KAJ0630006.1 hypothetical protein HanIR_Chr00c01g0903491 [Helianthus annuus]KAJ0648286.1 hypothetical protein HanLR1_Chr15g0571181 [Helianthus annuus]KAJ0830837.1 hypothetical protein HanPSC8_Chr15g0660061 [Helianthus annuus]
MDSSNDQPVPSNSELMASAKVMSDAVAGKETDPGKIAGAAADILDAAANYGKLDDKQGLGMYMDQTADYLHKYETTHTTTTTKTDTDTSGNQTTETTTTKTDTSGHKTTETTTSKDGIAPSCDDDKCT